MLHDTGMVMFGVITCMTALTGVTICIGFIIAKIKERQFLTQLSEEITKKV